MNRCPITYEEIEDSRGYSKKGLSLLSRNMEDLLPFPYSLDEQLQLAEKVRDSITEELKSAIPAWEGMIEKSFLPPEKKEQYRSIVMERAGRLFFSG